MMLTTMEEINGGLHPAVDGQSLGERMLTIYGSFSEDVFHRVGFHVAQMIKIDGYLSFCCHLFAEIKIFFMKH